MKRLPPPWCCVKGFTPYEAIAAGTVTASKVMGRMTGLDDFGQIRVGKRADLLLLEGNPLKDPAHIKTPRGVMAAGRYYDRKKLTQMISINIPVKTAIHCVHEPDRGLWTYLDVMVGKNFSGDPGTDIESIIVHGPKGPLDIRKTDFRYFRGLRDYWLKIPGAPQPGEYTVVVKGAGMEGRASDSQAHPLPIPLMDQIKMQPKGLVNTPGIRFSWQTVQRDTPCYYQLEIKDVSGGRVYKSPMVQNMSSHTLPNDFLLPGKKYIWRVRVTDHDNFIRVQNRTQSNWISLTMADKLEYQYRPPLQIDDGWKTSTLADEGVARDPIFNMIQALVDR